MPLISRLFPEGGSGIAGDCLPRMPIAPVTLQDFGGQSRPSRSLSWKALWLPNGKEIPFSLQTKRQWPWCARSIYGNSTSLPSVYLPPPVDARILNLKAVLANVQMYRYGDLQGNLVDARILNIPKAVLMHIQTNRYEDPQGNLTKRFPAIFSGGSSVACEVLIKS